jgi:hypothetical protein
VGTPIQVAEVPDRVTKELLTLSPGAQRAIIAIFFALLAVVYAFAWAAPAVGLYHDDAVVLVTAKSIASGHGYTIESLPHPIPQTEYPPLFPAVLALFTLVSQQAWCLKLCPLACTAGWLVLTHRLLLRIGASRNDALLLVGLTAASPPVVFLGTSLMPESLFAVLMTAALLMLLDERALLAGMFAGLATIAQTNGMALIAASIPILVVRRRFRGAVFFAAIAMAIVAPWFGWSLAHAPRDTWFAIGANIFTNLRANEKLAVLARNLIFVLASPFSLLTGMTNLFSVVATVVVVGGSLYVRRQLVPDLFVALYCLMLLCRTSPPERFVAPVFPLIFWIVWRAFRQVPVREAVAAAALVAALLPLWSDGRRLYVAHEAGIFPASESAPDNWNEMGKLFTYIRATLPKDGILLADQDSLFFLNTGHKAVRGFVPDGYSLYYAQRQEGVTPDRLSAAIVANQVNYVVLTPDRDFAESASFHRGVAALERGGVLEPVVTPGLPPDYRLLRVAH